MRMLLKLVRAAPLKQFYTLTAVAVALFVVSVKADKAGWVLGVVIGYHALAFMIKCAWCGNSMMIRYPNYDPKRWPRASWPFDSECGRCGRSMWTVPPIDPE